MSPFDHITEQGCANIPVLFFGHLMIGAYNYIISLAELVYIFV